MGMESQVLYPKTPHSRFLEALSGVRMDYMGESGRAGAGGNVAQLGTKVQAAAWRSRALGEPGRGSVGDGPGASCLQFPHSMGGCPKGSRQQEQEVLVSQQGRSQRSPGFLLTSKLPFPAPEPAFPSRLGHSRPTGVATHS